MIPPTSIDGTDITGATIDGTDVQEITVDGQTVFSAASPGADAPRLAQYPFDEGSGTTAADETGNQADFSFNGAFFVSDADAVGGFSVDMSGGAFCELTYVPNFMNDTFTVMMTIELDDLVGHQIFISFGGNNYGSLGLPGGSSIITAEGNDKQLEANSSITNSITRIGVEFDSNQKPEKIFIDGVDDTAGESNSVLYFGENDDVTLGKTNHGFGPMDGRIDNLIFYDGSLTSAQVQQDFNRQPYS